MLTGPPSGGPIQRPHKPLYPLLWDNPIQKKKKFLLMTFIIRIPGATDPSDPVPSQPECSPALTGTPSSYAKPLVALT